MLLITGGNSSIGEAAISKAGERKEKILKIVRSESNNKDEYVREIKADLINGGESVIDRIDQKERDQVSRIIFCHRYRPPRDGMYKLEDEIRVQITSPYEIIQKAYKEFDKLRSVICISSIASTQVALEQNVGYHIVRGGLESMIRKAAVECASRDIAINAIRVGYVKGEKKTRRDPEFFNTDEHVVPRGYAPTPNEIGAAIDTISSLPTSLITGQTINLDAGMSLLTRSSLGEKIRSRLQQRASK